MNTPIFTPRSRSTTPGTSGFTLIELLVVITIIAVLAGLLLPVINSVQTSAKKTSTKSTEMQIVAAINAYQTEYSQYPLRSGTVKDFTYDLSTNHNGELFDVLRALNNVQDSTAPTGSLNSRRIVYFEARNVKSPASPRDGFILSSTNAGSVTTPTGTTLNPGDLVDPFGNLYCIRMDGNYSNVIVNPYSDASTDASDDTSTTSTSTSTQDQQNQLRTGVIAYSAGPDGQMGNKGNVGTAPFSPAPGDDVDSWQ